MSNIRIDTILMVVLFVVTSGFAMSQIFEQLKRPYLITFSGSRMRLVTARAEDANREAIAAMIVEGPPR